MYYGKHHQRNKFIAILLILFGVFHIFSCSSQRRLGRLLKNHPELNKVEVKDSVFISGGEKVDTFFIVKNTYDTIQYGGLSVIRTRDTIRIVGRTKPCTTLVKQYRVTIGDTSRKPSRTEIRKNRKETKVKKTEQRRDSKYKYFLIISLLANAYLLMTNLALRYLNKQKDA